jgi:hypothetical protein
LGILLEKGDRQYNRYNWSEADGVFPISTIYTMVRNSVKINNKTERTKLNWPTNEGQWRTIEKYQENRTNWLPNEDK